MVRPWAGKFGCNDTFTTLISRTSVLAKATAMKLRYRRDFLITHIIEYSEAVVNSVRAGWG